MGGTSRQHEQLIDQIHTACRERFGAEHRLDPHRLDQLADAAARLGGDQEVLRSRSDAIRRCLVESAFVDHGGDAVHDDRYRLSIDQEVELIQSVLDGHAKTSHQPAVIHMF